LGAHYHRVALRTRHEHWTGREAAAWIGTRMGHPVTHHLGWRYLVRAKQSLQVPRPRHVCVDAEQQADFKKFRPLLKAVATAFPQAQVELWATDEHRIGLKPLLCRGWAPIGQRPVAVVRHRFAWRYLVGFVHPASGRTFFHLATTVSTPVFEAELAAFARQAGASPTKQIVLVLDWAGWHSSVKLRVPEHVYLPPLRQKARPLEGWGCMPPRPQASIRCAILVGSTLPTE
jgi:Winged helix-turn helix/DDE superfamily endonuclease